MNEKKLLPCPFCGGKAFIRLNKDAMKTYSAYCGNEDCSASPKVSAYGKEMVIELWNTRKPMERIVERLEEVWLRAEENLCPKDIKDTCHGIFCEICFMGTAIDVVKEEGGVNE